MLFSTTYNFGRVKRGTFRIRLSSCKLKSLFLNKARYNPPNPLSFATACAFTSYCRFHRNSSILLFVAPKCSAAVLPSHAKVFSPKNWEKRRDFGTRLSLSCDYGYTTTQRGTLICNVPDWRLEPSSFRCIRKCFCLFGAFLSASQGYADAILLGGGGEAFLYQLFDTLTTSFLSIFFRRSPINSPTSFVADKVFECHTSFPRNSVSLWFF